MPNLYKFQEQAVADLDAGKHICVLATGAGKTAVMFRWLRDTGKKRVVVITTATKARSGDMQKEAVLWNGQEWLDSLESFDVISWHKADKFSLNLRLNHLEDYAFAFDEVQKCKGYRTGMGYAFRRICTHCPVWTGYTATPGDDWKDNKNVLRESGAKYYIYRR